MRRFVTLFTAMFALSTGLLSAYPRPCPGEWSVTAEFLYLLPSVDDTYFVFVSSSATVPDGTRRNNDFCFEPAFRVGGIYSFCDCNLSLEGYYTRLGATHSRTQSGSFLSALVGPADLVDDYEGITGTIGAKNDLLYQRADLYFNQQLWCCCALEFNALAGVEFAYFRLREQYDYRNPTGTTNATFADVNLKSRSYGIGPEFGFAFNYCFGQFDCCCPGTLTLVGVTTGSILAVHTKEWQESFAETTLNKSAEDEHTWRIAPAFHARIGLNWATCFSCFNASVELGYLFDVYCRYLTRIIFPDDAADALSFLNYYNYGQQGLYLGLNIGF